jgi:hypothetical protein
MVKFKKKLIEIFKNHEIDLFKKNSHFDFFKNEKYQEIRVVFKSI